MVSAAINFGCLVRALHTNERLHQLHRAVDVHLGLRQNVAFFLAELVLLLANLARCSFHVVLTQGTAYARHLLFRTAVHVVLQLAGALVC